MRFSLGRKLTMSAPLVPEKCLEGVFAVNKPKSVSSAQVLRDLQRVFTPSKLFAPWLENHRAEIARTDKRNNFNRRKNDKRLKWVKLGHGGTLDPMATGVLIVGVGNGTRELQRFLNCTKTYEATILFGAATDTYDVMGKVLAKAPYDHINRRLVEEALASFRGKIMQRPPIYSALRMEGKRLYEYAREGKELPREIEARPMEVQELEIVEWLEPADHDYQWPAEEAEEEAKRVAQEIIHLHDFSNASAASSGVKNKGEMPSTDSGKRKRIADEDDDLVRSRALLSKRKEEDPSVSMSGALQGSDEEVPAACADIGTVSTIAEHVGNPASPSKGPPAVKLRMTVTSGFYVRSLSFDLGKKVGSLAIMSDLVRTRQGDFRLGHNVLEFEDIEKGEEFWGPKVESMLTAWEEATLEPGEEASIKP